MLDAAGRIVVAGYVEGATSTVTGVTRLQATGAIDTTFGTQGKMMNDTLLPNSLFAASDADRSPLLDNGLVLVGGYSNAEGRVTILMLDSSGHVEHGFDQDGNTYAPTFDVIVTDGLLLSGDSICRIGRSSAQIGVARNIAPIFRSFFDPASP